jgi:2-octaprenyl-6-methoxyphenol hydroxylase
MTASVPAAPSIPLRADVAIVGGGLVGTTLAVALGRAGFRVALIEQAPAAALADAAHDGRGSAIALGSKRILDGLGLWTGVAAKAGPILDIRVSDGPSRLFLHYDHREVSDDPLGWIVENTDLRRAAWSALRGLEAVTVLAPAAVACVERTAGRVRLALEDGRRVDAGLVVGADGRKSRIARAAGIAVTGWHYPQTALVCTVEHAEPHRGVAHERFLPAGPFALLPLAHPHRSSVVWTERAALAPAMLGLDDAAFSAAMQERFGDYLGRLAIVGRRWSWPLALHHASRYVDRRLALVGDAAHGIHPIAGQGLNLGLRDVAALAEVLTDARRLGLDVGDPTVLDRYQRWRRPDNVALLVATDALNRLFSTDAAPVRLARDLGLAVINRLPPVKAVFMRHAMGLVGELPRLARGEPL